jgi:hypothetical protein
MLHAGGNVRSTRVATKMMHGADTICLVLCKAGTCVCSAQWKVLRGVRRCNLYPSCAVLQIDMVHEDTHLTYATPYAAQQQVETSFCS